MANLFNDTTLIDSFQQRTHFSVECFRNFVNILRLNGDSNTIFGYIGHEITKFAPRECLENLFPG